MSQLLKQYPVRHPTRETQDDVACCLGYGRSIIGTVLPVLILGVFWIKMYRLFKFFLLCNVGRTVIRRCHVICICKASYSTIYTLVTGAICLALSGIMFTCTLTTDLIFLTVPVEMMKALATVASLHKESVIHRTRARSKKDSVTICLNPFP